MLRVICVAVGTSLVTFACASADEASDLAAKLREVNANIVSPEAAKEKQLDRMVERAIRARIHAAHRREAEAFAQIKTRADWESFRDKRIKALRQALGPLPELGKDLKLH